MKPLEEWLEILPVVFDENRKLREVSADDIESIRQEALDWAAEKVREVAHEQTRRRYDTGRDPMESTLYAHAANVLEAVADEIMKGE